MTVGILILHWGLGMRNTNTFYTFRCPQSLEMIRLYLYKKYKLERDMTLCGDKWLYEEASSLAMFTTTYKHKNLH